MIQISFGITTICNQAKPVIRKLSEFGNKKLTLRLRNFFLSWSWKFEIYTLWYMWLSQKVCELLPNWTYLILRCVTAHHFQCSSLLVWLIFASGHTTGESTSVGLFWDFRHCQQHRPFYFFFELGLASLQKGYHSW
jgi:hypothetical protein